VLALRVLLMLLLVLLMLMLLVLMLLVLMLMLMLLMLMLLPGLLIFYSIRLNCAPPTLLVPRAASACMAVLGGGC
jgi:hypothetical protein